MLRAAFIGAGRRAQGAHYPCVSRLDDTSIEAVAELDGERMETVVDGYNIPRSFGDHREMLEAVDPDMVYVVMGEQFMTSIAVDCMNAGKHVFIEKPAGASPEESQLLLEAAMANDVYCMVGYQRRYAAVTREAMRLVRERGPATLAIGEFHKHMLGADEPPRTTMWNDICHVVDLVRYMAGSEAVEVNAFQDTGQKALPADYNSLIRFANGAVGMVIANRSSGGRTLRAELHGVGLGCYMRIPEQLELYADGGEPQTLSGAGIDGAETGDTRAYDGTLRMHQHFAECIRTGRTPLTDIRDVVHTSGLVARLEGN
jgi:virulence factor